MQRTKILVILAATLLPFSACRRETKDERFRREYEQFTQKECPKDVNELTRMDSITYDIASRTLTEYYTVWGTLEVDSFYTDDIVADLREDILKSIKSSIQLKPYKDEGINFRYLYRSRATGEQIVELSYTRDDYAN